MCISLSIPCVKCSYFISHIFVCTLLLYRKPTKIYVEGNESNVKSHRMIILFPLQMFQWTLLCFFFLLTPFWFVILKLLTKSIFFARVDFVFFYIGQNWYIFWFDKLPYLFGCWKVWRQGKGLPGSSTYVR